MTLETGISDQKPFFVFNGSQKKHWFISHREVIKGHLLQFPVLPLLELLMEKKEVNHKPITMVTSNSKYWF